MIKETSYKLIWGAWAIGIYLLFVLLLLFYFNSRQEETHKHFVKKDEQRIRVALSSPQKTAQKSISKHASIPKKKIKSKPKHKMKQKTKKSPTKSKHKKVPVKKRAEQSKKTIKQKDTNRTHTKREKVSHLFAKVKPKHHLLQVSEKPIAPNVKQDLIKVTDRPAKASERISSSLKIQKSSDSGIENRYFAKVEEKLKGWPAQSEYAGEKAKVWLKIAPDGYFEFKVLSASNNDAFNEGLIAYLKQLQRLGFGAHKGTRAYEIEVEFIATE
jgi:outer membrane biosynthesis protein TonB